MFYKNQALLPEDTHIPVECNDAGILDVVGHSWVFHPESNWWRIRQPVRIWRETPPPPNTPSFFCLGWSTQPDPMPKGRTTFPDHIAADPPPKKDRNGIPSILVVWCGADASGLPPVGDPNIDCWGGWELDSEDAILAWVREGCSEYVLYPDEDIKVPLYGGEMDTIGPKDLLQQTPLGWSLVHLSNGGQDGRCVFLPDFIVRNFYNQGLFWRKVYRDAWRSGWIPSHRVTHFVPGVGWECTLVMRLYLDEDSPAYTAEEWLTEADPHFSVCNGYWLAQGEAFTGEVESLSHDPKLPHALRKIPLFAMRWEIALLPDGEWVGGDLQATDMGHLRPRDLTEIILAQSCAGVEIPQVTALLESLEQVNYKSEWAHTPENLVDSTLNALISEAMTSTAGYFIIVGDDIFLCAPLSEGDPEGLWIYRDSILSDTHFLSAAEGRVVSQVMRDEELARMKRKGSLNPSNVIHEETDDEPF